MTPRPSFFVCGTPSNRRGFEYVTDTGAKLPGEPSRYLDIFDPQRMSAGRTYVVQSLVIDGRSYSTLTVYEKINPNDDRSNRGAFIAAGVLSGEGASLEDVLWCFCRLMEILAELGGLRSQDNSFPPNFRLKDFAFREPLVRPPVLDLLDAHAQNTALAAGQDAYGGGFFFNDASGAGSGRVERRYFVDLDQADTIRQLEQGLDAARRRLDEVRALALKDAQSAATVVRTLEKRVAEAEAAAEMRLRPASGAERRPLPFDTWRREIGSTLSRRVGSTRTRSNRRPTFRGRREAKRLLVVPERFLNVSLLGLVLLLVCVIMWALGVWAYEELFPTRPDFEEPVPARSESPLDSPGRTRPSAETDEGEQGIEQSDPMRSVVEERSRL
jgi:hypothetical protein